MSASHWTVACVSRTTALSHPQNQLDYRLSDDVPNSSDYLWLTLIRLFRTPKMHDGLTGDRPNTSHDDNASASASTPITREGLPPTYRMRADAHYVEQLDVPLQPVIRSLRIAAIATDAEQRAEALPALVDSIKRYGILQPLLVQRRNGAMRL